MIISRFVFFWILVSIHITQSSATHSFLLTIRELFQDLGLKRIEPGRKRFSEVEKIIKSNEARIRGKIEALHQNPNEYMQEVMEYHKTLLDQNRLLTENDKKQQEHILVFKSDILTSSCSLKEDYLQTLCVKIGQKLRLEPKEFVATIEEEIKNPILTTKCHIKIFDVLDLEFWIQSLKFDNNFLNMENFKNLIGKLDEKSHFIALEMIYFDMKTLRFGFFPVPKTEKDSYMVNLLKQCYSFKEIINFTNENDNLLDYMIEDKNFIQREPARKHLEEFYDRLEKQNKLLRKTEIEQYELNMKYKGYRFKVISNHFEELKSVCLEISIAFAWPAKLKTKEAVMKILDIGIYETALCTITTVHKYKVQLYIRTIFNQRFLYILGTMKGSLFKPLGLVHLFEGIHLILGVLPPENPKNNVFGPNTNTAVIPVESPVEGRNVSLLSSSMGKGASAKLGTSRKLLRDARIPAASPTYGSGLRIVGSFRSCLRVT